MNTLTVEVLREYGKGRILVETGTAKGEGVAAALAAGFEFVYSIECNPDVFIEASRRFTEDKGVRLHLGDSAKVLRMLMGSFTEPVTFWLDAHWSTGEPEVVNADKCPLLAELEAIRTSPINEHTILIDDMRYFRGPGLPQWHNIKVEEIEERIRAINERYRIDYAVGVVPNDILVARIV